MAYRNPLAWDRHKRPGLFVSNRRAKLPKAEPFDWETCVCGIDLSKDFEEIDRMNEELDRLYIQSLLQDRIYRIQ